MTEEEQSEALHLIWMGSGVYGSYDRDFRARTFNHLLGADLIQIDLIREKVWLTDKGSAQLGAYYLMLGLGKRGAGNGA